MLGFIETIDQNITSFIISIFPRSPLFDMTFSFLSVQGLTVVIWLFILFLYISWEEYHHHEFILYFLLSFGVSTFLVNVVFKNIIQRLRPWVVWHFAQGGCPADFSFPSGHAAGAFSGAVIFAHFDPKRRFVYYTLAVLIAFSRVYLYCHFTFDVIVGGLIGYGVGKILLLALKKRTR